VNDFGGCPTEDVLAAIGLSFADLFDKPIAQRLTPVRRPFDPMAVLQAVAHEITVVVLIAGDVAEVDRVDEAQRDRLHAAARRLNAALEAIGEVAVPDEIKRIRRAVAA
jgi:hypothetical protein